jgi:hypothetical protein
MNDSSSLGAAWAVMSCTFSFTLAQSLAISTMGLPDVGAFDAVH